MISAGIVTFEPELRRLRDNLAAISPQVSAVVMFDNGSKNAADVRSLAAEFDNVEVRLGEQNFGIAAALNRLAEHAIASGADWLLTLDQDSVCPPGMVAALAAARTPAAALVTPFIVDRNKQSLRDHRLDALPATQEFRQSARKGAITSGALMRLEAWQSVGGFDERFFIDYVDYDFNQRVMNAGFTILRCNRTHLLHEVGHARRTWLRVPRRDINGVWRLERFYSFGHSASRCYYKARNRVLFTRKHGRTLGLTNEGAWQIPQQIALTILFEPDRARKLRAFLRGTRDGLREDLR